MANVDAKFGARPIGRVGGTSNGEVNRYYVNVADALYKGDIVAIEGTGDTDGVPSVIACTPCLLPVGVIVDFDIDAALPEDQLYKKSGDALYAKVADDPHLRFEIQTDAAIAATQLGLNGDLVFAEGSTVTGRSGMEFDIGTIATTAALHMRVIRVAQMPDNTVGDAAVIECTWNQHAYAGGEVGV